MEERCLGVECRIGVEERCKRIEGGGMKKWSGAEGGVEECIEEEWSGGGV